MILELKRYILGDKATLGRLFVNGNFECYTLEDKVRPDGVKIAGETAVPCGTFDVVVDFSQRFQRRMPHILNVPNFDGVRMHSGNTDKDTAGCVLLGRIVIGPDFLGESAVAFSNFFWQLCDVVDKGESVTITITEEVE